MQYLRRVPYYGSLALLAYMPFHVFLAQSLSLLTGGLDVWKLGKDGLLFALTMFAVCLVWGSRKSTRLFNGLVLVTVVYGLLHFTLWFLHPDIYRDSALLGVIYNNRLFCFTLLGLSAALLKPASIDQRFLLKLTLGVSTVVAVLGIIQYFLPADFLTHFGYSVGRGTRASFLIDDKAGLVRIMSTLREPNALAAYLIVPITGLITVILQLKDKNKRLMAGGVLGLHLLALLLTFSRSGWLGAMLSSALVVWWHWREWAWVFVKRFGFVMIAVAITLAVGAYSMRRSTFVQSYITHTSAKQSVNNLKSNDYHRLFVERGLRGIAQNPLGHGPGTAGLASIQNPKGSFLTENYYVQIGYEVGMLGLLIFIGTQGVLYRELWRYRGHTLPVTLLASFWAYVLTNMLLHTWSNEAVAAQWWLLAGLVLVVPTVQPVSRQK